MNRFMLIGPLDFALEIEKEDPNIGETSGEVPRITPERVTNIFNTKIMTNMGNVEQGRSNMSDGPIINVGSRQAGRDIIQAGGDIYQVAVDLNILNSEI